MNAYIKPRVNEIRSDNNRPHGEENRIAHVQTQVINIHELPINTSIHIQ